MKRIYGLSILACAIALSGCTNDSDKLRDGGNLAKASGDFAQCLLEHGEKCTLKAPSGATFENTSVASKDDAIRVYVKLVDRAECLKFAYRVVNFRAGYMTQTEVNNTVVAAYNVPWPIVDSLLVACKEGAPSYKASLTVARSV